MSRNDQCPCCAERALKASSFTFLPASLRPGACESCVLPAPPPLSDDLPPFRWPRTVDEIQQQVRTVEAASKQALDAVAAVADGHETFENVIEPLMSVPHYKTNPMVCQAKFLQHCSTQPEVRAAADAAGTAFATLKARGRTRADVYRKVKAFSVSAACAGLSKHNSHFVSSLLASFEASGLGLSTEEQARLQELREKDAAVCSAFKKNLAEDTTALFFAAEELDGVDPKWVAERTQPEGGSQAGQVKVTLKYPDLLPVLSTCAVSATRERLSRAREVEAYANNLELVAQGVTLRRRIAVLLGRSSWAQHATATRMSGSPAAVEAFSAPLLARAKAGAARDLEALRVLKVAHLRERGELDAADGADRVRLLAHDVAFYSSERLKREYGVDQEAVRAYFPLDHVVETTMAIYQELLGLVFHQVDQFDTWHPKVRLFRVMDASNGERVGFFYLDLHPREGKYGHAAIFHLLKRWKGQTPVDCMLCNLPAPSADGTPALLRHSDCVTFFHEFGHIMHGLCSEGEANGTTLAKCPRDFVEAPSQMLENWCWARDGLRRLSRHHQTSAPLPTELLEKMIAAKNVGEGLGLVRQVYLSSLDLAIHGEAPPADAAGLQALVDEMRPRLSLVDNPPGANMLRSFGHLMNQYSAAYYGYMWAEVLSADMFATCFEANPFDKEAGMRYRKLVLAPGGVGKISEHLERFLGRPPSQDAFLKSRGIA